ncbi:MAG: DUF2141 domain-containing protein [Halioglobus sp.]
MKTVSNIILMLSVLLFNTAYSVAEEASVATKTALRVEVSGLQDAQGSIHISVYNSDDTWLGEETVLRREVVIADARSEGVVSAELHLPPGEYALSIYYDSNGNGDLDTNFIGIPKEPVASSNNAPAKFGPPKYKDAVFTLGNELVTQRISMEKI